MRREYRVESLPEPLSHYTDAVRINNLLFISGIVGMDEENQVAEGGTVGQAQQIFKNLQKVFDAVGGGIGFKDVLKVTVYMLDVNERQAINPIRQEFFGSHKPASTLIGVKELALPQLRIEIEAVAAIPEES
ncbi:MAG: Endoribonuclease [Paucimonas sp.]|nr:Endoribonuclease [Paucimonas sp.]